MNPKGNFSWMKKKDDGLEKKKKKDSSLGGTLSSKMILGFKSAIPSFFRSLNYSVRLFFFIILEPRSPAEWTSSSRDLDFFLNLELLEWVYLEKEADLCNRSDLTGLKRIFVHYKNRVLETIKEWASDRA